MLELLQSKDEVEQLDLVLIGSFSGIRAQEFLTSLSVVNHITGKLPCPNMKVLGLRFFDAYRGEVVRPCRQMMDNRRLAGYSLEKCYIWLREDDWEKVAPLVLVMENGKVRIEG